MRASENVSNDFRILFFLIIFVFSSSVSAEYINVAPLAKIETKPYIGSTTSYLTDSVIDSGQDTLVFSAPLAPRYSGKVPLTVKFTFDQGFLITKVRIYQYELRGGRAPAKKFNIKFYLNKTENTVAINENNGKGGKWYTYEVTPPVFADKVVFDLKKIADVKGPNYGVPALAEIEIMTSTKVVSASNELVVPYPLINKSPEKVNKIKIPESYNNLSWRDQYPRGIFATMWNFWQSGSEYSEKHASKVLKKFDAANANRLWLYTEMAAKYDANINNISSIDNTFYKYYAERRKHGEKVWKNKGMYKFYPFPSNVVTGYGDNILKKLIETTHDHNIGVFLNQRFLPFGIKSWDFPRVFNGKKYPCILSSSFILNASTNFYKELMESKPDGIAIGGDEFFFYGHTGLHETSSKVCAADNVSKVKNCTPTCPILFFNEYGRNWPGNKIEDTTIFMQKKKFEYEHLATFFRKHSEILKNSDDQVITTSLFRAGQMPRASYGVAYDVLGFSGGINEIGSDPLWSNDNYNGHYFPANETKKLAASSPQRKSVLTFQVTPYFKNEGYKRPVMVYGPAISALMNGATGINYYKQDHMYTGDKNDPGPWIEKVYRLISWLDSNGLKNYKVPKNVAVLYSRAVEDLWMEKYRKDKVKMIEPTSYQNSVMEVLFKKGIPFDLFYTDQPQSLGVLPDYDIIILPYAESYPKNTWKKIDSAQMNGAEIVWLKGAAIYDETGKPSNDKVIAKVKNNVVNHKLNLSSYREVENEITGILQPYDELIPLQCGATADEDVECGILVNGSNYLVFVQNWSENDAAVNIKTNLMPGDYNVKLIDLEKEYIGTMSDKNVLNSFDLNKFSLTLTAGEVIVLKIDHI